MSSPPSFEAPWSLADKTAIVTGGSRGIGQAIAIHLSRKGLTKLAITYATNDQAEAVAIQADALDPEFGPKLIAQALERLNTTTIDILVNNAVLTDHSRVLPVKETTLQSFFDVMQGNVYAPVTLTTALLPHLPAYGGRANADPTMTYGASKTALQSYTRSFAEAFSKESHATFNSVIVGLTLTDSIKASKDLMPPGYFDAQIRDTSAADRIGVPEDIAYIVGFLSSEEGRWVNGAAISANGGNKLVMPALG
ncbi:hypothetical protein LCI18_003344 [Fusarium solani-melongenae]|uniref:Uncharacterized protein n=1 Tax=Fusarium solani subsp. cucurbitae TaxID=2747967 RepID=A0ACD3YTX8_FUSSC|nr:hypothetical protein LCI18_003344 [Fusarium solani-melongenae]